jgi:tRNA(Ile)-lysidine synthase
MPDPVTSLAEQARATSERYGMLPDGAVAVLMVSGGGDSVALLRLMADGALGEQLTWAVLHVDHMLRGEESDADEAFCRTLCEELGVELFVRRVDVSARARAQGLNLEEAGRLVRYHYADEVLDELSSRTDSEPARGRIMVAHTRDDRVETSIMRLAQGAGATGLTSLRPTRDRIVRPLIDCSRVQVREYLEAIGQPWREDATNEDTDRLRAKVRAQLLPVLREVNPRFDESLARSLGVLADEDDMLSEMAEAFVDDWIDVGEGEISLDRAMLGTLSRPMLRRTVRQALGRAFPELSRLEYEHTEALVDGVSVDGFAHDLPGGIRAFDEYGRMVVSRSGGKPESLGTEDLPVPSEIDLGETGVLIAEEVSLADTAASSRSIVIDADKLDGDMAVGPPREGERMQPLGMEGTKKLSDLLIDEKVPCRVRGCVPVVRDASHVVWLGGVRMSETHKLDEGTSRAVRLTWRPAVDERIAGDDER